MDKTFRVWDLKSGEVQRIISVDSIFSCFDIDANSEFLVAGGMDGLLFFYDLKNVENAYILKFDENSGEIKANKEKEVLVPLNDKTKASNNSLENGNKDEIEVKRDKKVRNVRFTIDCKMVVVSDRNKLGYYLTSDFIKRLEDSGKGEIGGLISEGDKKSEEALD